MLRSTCLMIALPVQTLLVAENPAPAYRKQAISAVGDLLNHFWTGAADTGHIMGTSHGYAVSAPGNERGVLWERGMMFITLGNLWRLTADATLQQRLQADWNYTKSKFSSAQLEACGQASGFNWASDDAGWSALMYLAAYRVTSDPDALARARGLVRASIEHWMDVLAPRPRMLLCAAYPEACFASANPTHATDNHASQSRCVLERNLVVSFCGGFTGYLAGFMKVKGGFTGIYGVHRKSSIWPAAC